jgi:hypothetical protein
MSNKNLYYRGDTRISEADARDYRGHIKDGITVKVPAMMRDSDPTRFTDGSGDPWSASRPGFRVRVGDTRKAQRDAIAEYERELTNRWRCGDQERVCPECDGTGELNGEDCEACNGSGTLPAGGYDRSPDTAMPTHPPARVTDAAEHRKIMDQLYHDYDRTISEQWRQR